MAASACVLALHAAAYAQPPETTLSFEVASVKPNKGGGPTESGTQPGGRVSMINVPLRMLIRSAYRIQDDQIADAPDWIGVEHFDVVARAPGDIAPPTPGKPGPLALMMQSLLADRFKLAVHRETRELPAYSLEPARRDRKPGPQLRASTTDCAAIAGRGQDGNSAADDRPKCGIRASGGRMAAGGLPMTQLALTLSRIVGRAVIDNTGLAGGFDFELRWTPDQMAQGQPGTAAVPAGDPDAPSIFTALQEQLGLKLQPAKRPVAVLVIDHVERPTPN